MLCQPNLVAGIKQTDQRELGVSPDPFLLVTCQVVMQPQANIANLWPHLGNGHGAVTRLGLGPQPPARHNSGQYLFITGQFYRVSAHFSHHILSLSHLNRGQVCAVCLCPLPLSLALTTDQVSLSAHFSCSPTLHMSTSLPSKHCVTLYLCKC